MQIVMPGDVTPVSGEGTWWDEDNKVSRACRIGYIEGNHIKCLIERANRIPSVGETLIGRITRITNRFAALDIEGLVSNQETILKYSFPIKGTIRINDIYPIEELEPPVMQSCFRPGDLVRAKVIGRGEPSAGLLLSTAEIHLGVIYAESEGRPLQILSWNEMINPLTGQREKRKCAKPFQ